jgi:peptidyl-prolyl cis-trans isomerase C
MNGGMTIKERARIWLGEPLIHFLLAGLAVFAFSAWRGEPVDLASRTIEIGEEQTQRLAEQFALVWRRPPTPSEIDGLIRDHIKEEVYYREALRLGLEADDPIIRRRLRSKMEFLAASEAESVIPDDSTLQAWLDRQAAHYAVGNKYSFDQIYLGQDDVRTAEVAALKLALEQGNGWQKMGTSISLPGSLEQAEAKQIDREFGDGFAASMTQLEPGKWSGPVASGFGTHLVRLRQAVPGRKPLLAEVRQRVENDWRAATAKEREARAYQALLDGYDIRIAKP